MQKVDVHCHLFSPGLAESIDQNTPFHIRIDRQRGIMSTFLGLELPLMTEEDRVAEMKRIGVDRQVIAVRTAALLEWGELAASPENRLSLARTVNDYLSMMCQEHPLNFGAFADIPLALGDSATEEMIRALDRLKLSGITLLTNYGDKYLDAPEFQPFFEEANRRRAVIFIHPTHPFGREVLMDYHMYGIVGFPHDTSLTAGRMAYAGFFQRFPNITVILSHVGGTIPFLWWRMDLGYHLNWLDCRSRLKAPPTEFLKQLYYDTALSDAESLMHAYRRIGDHLVLGTDHPYVPGGGGAHDRLHRGDVGVVGGQGEDPGG